MVPGKYFLCRLLVCVRIPGGKFVYMLRVCVGDTGGRIICSTQLCVWYVVKIWMHGRILFVVVTGGRFVCRI